MMEKFTVAASVNSTTLSHRPIIPFNSTNPISFPHKPTFSSSHHHHRPDVNPISLPPSTMDTELSIFTAERYFKDNPDDQKQSNRMPPTPTTTTVDISSCPRDSSVSSADGYGRNCRRESFHVTPTASSEASWNSQSGLLANPPGSVAVTVKALPEQRRRSSSPSSTSSSWRWRLGRGCPCSGRRSVDVEEKFSEFKTSNHAAKYDLGSDGSAVLRKQTSRTEDPTLKDSDMGLVVKEMSKLRVIAGNWDKEEGTFPSSDLFPPETRFPASDKPRHRIVSSAGPFSDGGGFSFPILTKPMAKNDIVPPRDSLEVFRPKDDTPPALVPLRKSAEYHRRWAAVEAERRRSFAFAFPGSPKPRAIDDDVASDTSSDLFEIESFSTQMTSAPTYRRRDSLDEILGLVDPRRFSDSTAAGILQVPGRMSVPEEEEEEEGTEPARPSTIAPSECYPPSEVSVQWSVTTAEGFATNFSSAASDHYEESRLVGPPAEQDRSTSGGGGGGRRKVNGGFLGCRFDKAVSIGPHPVRCMPEQRKERPMVFAIGIGPARVGSGGAAAAAAAMHLSSSRAADRPPLARSHSARMTRPIQTR